MSKHDLQDYTQKKRKEKKRKQAEQQENKNSQILQAELHKPG